MTERRRAYKNGGESVLRLDLPGYNLGGLPVSNELSSGDVAAIKNIFKGP